MDWLLADVEQVARGKLSRLAYDYAAGGAGEERTLADNVDAFRRRTLRPRYLVDVSKRDLSTTLLGRVHPAPFGCAGVVVSNHGARMLDRVPATLDVLPSIASAVEGRIPIVLDGGVRRGVDALIALASGASFAMIGRQVVWGLAAGGEAGVGRVLDLFREELDNAMALTGCRSVADVGRGLLSR